MKHLNFSDECMKWEREQRKKDSNYSELRANPKVIIPINCIENEKAKRTTTTFSYDRCREDTRSFEEEYGDAIREELDRKINKAAENLEREIFEPHFKIQERILWCNSCGVELEKINDWSFYGVPQYCSTCSKQPLR